VSGGVGSGVSPAAGGENNLRRAGSKDKTTELFQKRASGESACGQKILPHTLYNLQGRWVGGWGGERGGEERDRDHDIAVACGQLRVILAVEPILDPDNDQLGIAAEALQHRAHVLDHIKHQQLRVRVCACVSLLSPQTMCVCMCMCVCV